MGFIGLLYLLLAHFVTGRGVLQLFRLQLPLLSTVCLSFIIGVPVVSFVPCVVQLLGLPIVAGTIVLGVAILSVVLLIPVLMHYRPPVWPRLRRPALYEWPFLLLFLLAVVTSVWRCYYYPVTARDMLAGPEALAEFAVREYDMVSSVFSIDLQTTNNHFKSPFITALQIVYKLLVGPFGQLWLSVISVPFLGWIYSMLRNTLHPLLAGMLFVAFFTIPDLYAYSFMILYDYSNMVFFFLGYYYLIGYAQNKETRYLAFTAFLLGLATYIRTETLILIGFMLPVLAFYQLRWRRSLKKSVGNMAMFMLVPAAFYFVCIKVFVARFVPMTFDLSTQVNQHVADMSPFVVRLREMSSKLIFATAGVNVYGWFVFFFCAVFVLDLVITRKFSHIARLSLLGVVIVYIGLAFIGYLLPLADIINTTKRGLFKLLPLALLYMANSALLLRFSARIRRWESEV
jgi:hypothetical protein